MVLCGGLPPESEYKEAIWTTGVYAVVFCVLLSNSRRE
jgi:hypothetical protein